MTTRKNQNSILVLATLGVYLGLVLVGATPQVLAQAAMTRQFNVKDEIEVKDDLDKKPDQTVDEFEGVVGTYFSDLRHLLSALEKQQSENSNAPFGGFSTKRLSHSPCFDAESSLFREFSFPINNRFTTQLDRAKLASTLHLSHLSDCLPYFGFKDQTKARLTGIEISYGGKELRYQVLFDFGSPERTKLVLDGIGSAIQVLTPKDNEDNQVQTVLYKHTQLTSVKNQVFIVTILPRAGLDSLLAANAK